MLQRCHYLAPEPCHYLAPEPCGATTLPSPGAGRTLSFDALLGPLTGGWLSRAAPATADEPPYRGGAYRGATWVVLLLRLQLAVVRLLALNLRVLLVVDLLVVVVLPATYSLLLTRRSTSSPSCGSYTPTGSLDSAAASPSSPSRSRLQPYVP